jgi:hypothetical protein
MPDEIPAEPANLILNDLEREFEFEGSGSSNMTSETMPRFGGTKGPNQEVRIEIDGEEVPIRAGGGDFSEPGTWETTGMWSLPNGEHTFRMTTVELRTDDIGNIYEVESEPVERTFEVFNDSDSNVNWQATRNRIFEESNWAETEGMAMQAGEAVLPPQLIDPRDHGFDGEPTEIQLSRDRDLRRRREDRDARLRAGDTVPEEPQEEQDVDQFIDELKEREAQEEAASGGGAGDGGGGGGIQGDEEKDLKPPEPVAVPQAAGPGAGGAGSGGGGGQGGGQGGPGQGGQGQGQGEGQGQQPQGQQPPPRVQTGGSPPDGGPIVVGIEKGNGQIIRG